MKTLFSLTLILVLCCGCSPFEKDDQNSQNLLLTANELQLYCIENHFTAETLIPGGLPIPMDHLMLNVYHNAQKSEKEEKIFFHIPKQPSLIAKFNAYASEKILSGKKFVPEKERHQFILSQCGKKAAPHMIEYFRVLERRTLHTVTTAGVTNGIKLHVFDFYNIPDLDDFQSYLEQAKEAARNTSYEKIINSELDFFLSCRKKIETALDKAFPCLYPEEGTEIILNTLRGAAPKQKTVVKCEYSADRTALILKMEADEPQMNLRKIADLNRDYPLAWKDDRFEIFFVPNPEKMSDYYQFIITSGGVLWDGRRIIKGFPDREWNSNAKLKVTHYADRWKAELIIPLADIGFSTPPVGISRFNIFRFREIKGKNTESYALAPILSGQNFQPERFGKIFWNKENKK